MSRKEITGENFTIAFGVDHATGAFAQLWVNPADEQDAALIIVTGYQLDVDYEASFEFPAPLRRYCDQMAARIKQFSKANPGVRANLGEQDVIDLARAAGGFPDIAAEVYRVFGDDI